MKYEHELSHFIPSRKCVLQCICLDTIKKESILFYFFVNSMLAGNPSECKTLLVVHVVPHTKAHLNSKLSGCDVYRRTMEETIHKPIFNII